MENNINTKYYDIITELVKEHPKYSGCESILEEIVKDAHEHAQVIISTITNEDVIIAYLRKIITTSLITVPKRFNINTRKRERKTFITHNQNTFSEEISQKSTSFEDLELALNSAPINETETTNKIENSYDTKESFEQVNVSLVDKMINGVKDTEVTTTLENHSKIESIEELVVEDVEEEVVDEIVQEDNLIDESSDDLIVEDDNITLFSNEIDTSNELFLESSDENSFELDINNEEIILNEDVGAFENSLFESDSNNNIVEVEKENSNQLDNTRINATMYKLFEYEPNIDLSFKDDIYEAIAQFAEEYPEIKILDICDLKYNQNKSAVEISQILCIDKTIVIETLNEIMTIVKE